MSQQGLIARVRLTDRTGARRLCATMLAGCLLHAATVGAAILPVTAGCRSDDGGANDVAGESDLTRYCAEAAAGSPFELETAASLDLARLEGAATIRVCSLYNTDGDAFANFAVCAAVKRATGNNGNQLVLNEVRLFTCSDTAADRCASPTLLPGPYSTQCQVGQEKEDPFPGPAPGPGTHYPEDTLIRCSVDTADFSASGAVPLDTCSYGSAAPDAAPIDCLAFRACSSHAECEDGSPCTADSCDASGVCRYAPQPGAACEDGRYCNGDEACTALGLCGSAGETRDCDDGVDCTLDSCDEITDACVNDPRNSVCSDGLYCTGVEVCDPEEGCRAGTPPNCSDGIDCTVDACSETRDGCDHSAEDASCVAVLARLAGQLP